MSDVRIAIGLMSGTSADGIDAVACRVKGTGIRMQARLLAHVQRRFPPAIRAEILAVAGGESRTAEQMLRLDVQLGRLYADAARSAIRKARVPAHKVSVIGCHGQTMARAAPARISGTWQIGQAAVVAAETGVRTVGRFRDADMAIGGHGAPLVPWTDYVLLRDRRVTRCVQNIGGIANVTYLPAGGDMDDVRAFDTGPGNMVIDGIVEYLSKGRHRYDAGGRMAAGGIVNQPLLNAWMRNKYFRRPPPKSCGREQFGRAFWQPYVDKFRRMLRLEDFVATATRWTARSIADAYRRHLPSKGGRPLEIVLCGGGAKNRTLWRMLEEETRIARVRGIEEFGIDVQAKEALSFALLALACVDGVPANLPRVTGARRAVVLGQIAPSSR